MVAGAGTALVPAVVAPLLVEGLAAGAGAGVEMVPVDGGSGLVAWT